jgi:hypothetical protein
MRVQRELAGRVGAAQRERAYDGELLSTEQPAVVGAIPHPLLRRAAGPAVMMLLPQPGQHKKRVLGGGGGGLPRDSGSCLQTRYRGWRLR